MVSHSPLSAPCEPAEIVPLEGKPLAGPLRMALCAGFALSGTASLMFEVLWFRALGLGSGQVTGSVAVITAAYMGGMALGNQAGGWLAERMRRRLAAYATVEWAVVFCALWIPSLTGELAALARTAESLPEVLAAWGGAVLVLLVPTFAMGMTLPLITSSLNRSPRRLGFTVGLLYALNTAGAMIGALLTGFVVLPLLGEAAGSAVAIGLQSMAGTLGMVAAVASGPQQPMVRRPRTAEGRTGAGVALVLGVAALASLAAMLVQVTWTTMATGWAGSSTVAFSSTVFIYLLGLSAGGLVAARFVDRVDALEKLASRVLLAIGAAVGVGMAVATWAPGGGSLILTVSLLPATVGMGALFPTFVRAVAKRGRSVGLSVGSTSAATTAGAVAGCLSGAALVPWAGSVASLGGALLLYVCLASLMRLIGRSVGV
jgi:spermidine synthase